MKRASEIRGRGIAGTGGKRHGRPFGMLRLEGRQSVDGLGRIDPVDRLEEALSGEGSSVELTRRDRRLPIGSGRHGGV
jgi:hypothetical protein